MHHLPSDRPLDEQVVSGLIAAQFPGLRGQPVSRLGAGRDNEVFRVGGKWVLRFPRRANRVAWLTREITVMAWRRKRWRRGFPSSS